MGIYTKRNRLNIDSDSWSLPTYYCNGSGYAAYATPTDMLTISGASGKIVRVYNILLRVHTTAAALATVKWIKRSTANSGGTSSTPTITPFDSNDPAASAVVRLYSVIPAGLGTTAISVDNHVVTTTPTAVPSIFQSAGMFGIHTNDSYPKPVILRSSSESLCANYGGAALPAGFTAWWEVIWTEETV